MNNLKFSTSIEKREEFKNIFPDGVNSPLRLFSEVDSEVLVMKEASGSEITDIDGNVYTDFITGLGSLILGHSRPEVVQAVQEQLTKGTIFSCCHETEADFGNAVAENNGFIEKVRFVCSGTEAVMGAIRAARAYTKKEKIVRFTGNYHGHSDDVFYREESNVESWRSIGLVESKVSTLTCPYGDAKKLELILEEENDVAAIIIEPVASNMGLEVPSETFIKQLRTLSTQYGCLLIFDEVVSGFRFCYGSVANLFNVEPDIVCFGKIIGGGFSVGCFGGKAEYMNVIERVPGYFQGGTFAANPITCAAGIQTLKLLSDSSVYKTLDEKGALFESTVCSLNDDEFEIDVKRFGSLITLIPGSKVSGDFIPCDWRDVFSHNFNRFLNEGILLPPSVDEPIFISTAHSKKQIEESASKIARIIKDYLISN